jgi:hypothetical protein
VLRFVAPVTESAVDDALPSDEEADVRLVVEALVDERSPVTFALLRYAVPLEVRLVVDAFVMVAFTMVAFVVQLLTA